MFARARPLQVAGVSALALGDADCLVYACGHLALHHEYDDALFRYYGMAASILQAGSHMDWNAVVTRSQAWRLVLPVQRVLARLAGLWLEIVPAQSLKELARLQPARSERLVHHVAVAYKDNHSVRALLAWLTQPGLGRRLSYPVEKALPGPA